MTKPLTLTLTDGDLVAIEHALEFLAEQCDSDAMKTSTKVRSALLESAAKYRKLAAEIADCDHITYSAEPREMR